MVRLCLFVVCALVLLGCHDKAGSYSIKVVFPNLQTQRSIDTFELWVLVVNQNACDSILDGSLDPLVLPTYQQFSFSLDQEESSMRLLEIPYQELVFYGRGVHQDRVLLHACQHVDLGSRPEILVTLEMTPACLEENFEIACNHIDDDCDGKIDECLSDEDCQHNMPCLSSVCDRGQCECLLLDGTECDDGLFCTVGEICRAGECKESKPRDCTAQGGGCIDGHCHEESNQCIGNPLPEGTPCLGEDQTLCNSSCDGQGLCIDTPHNGHDGCEGIESVWLSQSSAPYTAGNLTSAILSDGLHLLGGTSAKTAEQGVGQHYLYDSQNKTWSSSPAEIGDTDTAGAQAQVYDDRLYLIGGWPHGKRLRVYDPLLNSWESLSEMPVSYEYGFVSAMVGGFLFVIGGHPGDKKDAPVYKFDLTSKQWAQCESIPKNEGKGSLAGTAVGDKIYVLNGDRAGGRTSLQIYDTVSDSWSKGKDLGHHFEAASAVSLVDKIFFFGGATDHDSHAPVDVKSEMNIYDTQADTWSEGPTMTTARMQSTAQYLDGHFHVIGGFDSNQNAVHAHEIFAQ